MCLEQLVAIITMVFDRNVQEAIPVLGYPSIRVWELNGSSTRYDRMRAAPSDEELHNMWIGYAVAFFLLSTFNFVVFLGIVLKRKVRSSPFNQYLIGLMVTDILFTGGCAIQCAFLAARGGYHHSAECYTQSFYLIWAISANSWLNAAIANECHTLLWASNRRQRYFPPKSRKVLMVTVASYLWAALIASFGLIVAPQWPQRTDSFNGFVCVPIEFSVGSSFFFWLFFYPLLSLIPLLYTIWVAYDVIRRKWLPSGGKKREIVVFYFRILVVFVVMWLPSLIIFFAAGGGGRSTWVAYIAGLWSHATGAASAAVSLLKRDIRQSFVDLLRCRTFAENRRDSHESGSLRMSSTLRRRGQERFRSEATFDESKQFDEECNDAGQQDAQDAQEIQEADDEDSSSLKTDQEVVSAELAEGCP